MADDRQGRSGSFTAPAEELAARTRMIAVLCELWCSLGPLALIGVISHFTIGRRDTFLRRVTAEVLNLQLVTLITWVLVMAAGGAGWSVAAWFLYLAWIPVALYSYVVGIIGAVRAWRGEAWSYPLNLSVVQR